MSLDWASHHEIMTSVRDFVYVTMSSFGHRSDLPTGVLNVNVMGTTKFLESSNLLFHDDHWVNQLNIGDKVSQFLIKQPICRLSKNNCWQEYVTLSDVVLICTRCCCLIIAGSGHHCCHRGEGWRHIYQEPVITFVGGPLVVT